MASVREALDLACLRDHQHRRVRADRFQLDEDVDARVVLGERVDLAPGELDLAVEVIDQPEQAVEPATRRLPQLELGEEAASVRAEQALVRGAAAHAPPKWRGRGSSGPSASA